MFHLYPPSCLLVLFSAATCEIKKNSSFFFQIQVCVQSLKSQIHWWYWWFLIGCLPSMISPLPLKPSLLFLPTSYLKKLDGMRVVILKSHLTSNPISHSNLFWICFVLVSHTAIQIFYMIGNDRKSIKSLSSASVICTSLKWYTSSDMRELEITFQYHTFFFFGMELRVI